MKKILLLFVLFILSTHVANAQIKTYFKADAVGSVVNSKVEKLDGTYKRIDHFYTPLIRPTIGFGLEYQFADNGVKLVTGLEWTQRGYREPDAKYDTIPGVVRGQISDMLSFPVNIGYRINDKFLVLAGGRVDKNIWKNKNYLVIYEDYTGGNVYNSITAGANLGIEYHFNKNITVGAEYCHNFTSFTKDEPLVFKTKVESYYRSLSLYARFSFMK